MLQSLLMIDAKPTLCFVEHISLKKQALLLEEVQKLNQENVEKSGQQLSSGHLDLEAGVSPEDEQRDPTACSLVDYQCEESQPEEKIEAVEVATEVEEVEEKVQDEEELVVEDVTSEKEEDKLPVLEEEKDVEVSSGSEGSKAAQEEEVTASR